jgi:hypothetical protein
LRRLTRLLIISSIPGNDEINMLDENVVKELRKCMDNAAIDEEK